MQIVGTALAEGWTGKELPPTERKRWPPVPTEGDPDLWMKQLGEGLFAGKSPDTVNRLRAVADWIHQQGFWERLGLWYISEAKLRLSTLPAADYRTPEARAVIATGYFFDAQVFVQEDELARHLAGSAGGAGKPGKNAAEPNSELERWGPVSWAELRRAYDKFVAVYGLSHQRRPGRSATRGWGRKAYQTRVTQARLDELHASDAEKYPRSVGRPSNKKPLRK
jgi:hypothetical protein